MKVVLDSNILIAAFATQGLCHLVYELCIEKHTIIVSNKILKEVTEGLVKKIKLPDSYTNQIINYVKANSITGEIASVPVDACRDSNDLHVLGLAVKAEANYIITGDKDLLVVKKIQRTRIVSPREFWELGREETK